MNDVRENYRKLTNQEVERLGDFKRAGQVYIDALKALPSSRENSLAIINAEQSVMWAVKGLTT